MTIEDLGKAVIPARLYHCKQCRKTGIRFDAKKLGFRVSQFEGSKEYKGSCVGCYWHDTKAFIVEASMGFKKPDESHRIE